MLRYFIIFCSLCTSSQTLQCQSSIFVTPGNGDVLGGAYGELYGPYTSFLVSALDNTGTASQVKFKVDSIIPPTGLFVVLPSIGTTPQRVVVGLNPKGLALANPLVYRIGIIFTTVDQTPTRTGVALML